MGISPSTEVDLLADVTLTQPCMILPLDITSFIIGWSKGVPPSLKRFSQLSTELQYQLKLLPGKHDEIPKDWILISKQWSQAVIKILKDMHSIVVKLLKERPIDLKGNYHPIEEWTSELESTLIEFKAVFRPLERIKAAGGPGGEAFFLEAVDAIRRIHLLRAPAPG